MLPELSPTSDTIRSQYILDSNITVDCPITRLSLGPIATLPPADVCASSCPLADGHAPLFPADGRAQTGIVASNDS